MLWSLGPVGVAAQAPLRQLLLHQASSQPAALDPGLILSSEAFRTGGQSQDNMLSANVVPDL